MRFVEKKVVVFTTNYLVIKRKHKTKFLVVK